MADGFVSSYLLDRVKPGDMLESTSPGGTFYHEPLMDTDELVFLAGGSGITPFMSIIREAAAKERPFRMHLVYGSRRPLRRHIRIGTRGAGRRPRESEGGHGDERAG